MDKIENNLTDQEKELKDRELSKVNGGVVVSDPDANIPLEPNPGFFDPADLRPEIPGLPILNPLGSDH